MLTTPFSDGVWPVCQCMLYIDQIYRISLHSVSVRTSRQLNNMYNVFLCTDGRINGKTTVLDRHQIRVRVGLVVGLG